MAKKKNKNKHRDADWAEAKRVCQLDAATVRMGQALGLNPLKLIERRPHPPESGKKPASVWIHDLHKRAQKRAEAEKAREFALSAEFDFDLEDLLGFDYEAQMGLYPGTLNEYLLGPERLRNLEAGVWEPPAEMDEWDPDFEPFLPPDEEDTHGRDDGNAYEGIPF